MRADWVSVAEATAAILDAVSPLPPERVPLLRALGRVLAEEIVAPLDLPPWDNSAMDGYAVRSEDVRGATAESPRELTLVDDVPAGGFPSRAVPPGGATRVMTGAPVPEGADGVVRVEHTTPGEGDTVRIVSDADAGTNIRRKGEDLRAGDRVIERGRLLRPAEIGVAASLGRAELTVTRAPVVGILTSGDELVEVDRFAEVLAGRRIVSSNTYSLAALVAEAGLTPRVLGIAADTPEGLRAHLERARGCDALITTAGMSVGEHDYVREVLLSMGLSTRFWRVRMRPGSPVAFGTIGELGGLPWFGLPGNPVSCMVTFELFVRPALLRMAGARAVHRPVVTATLDEDYPLRPGLTQFVRVRLTRGPDGEPRARLTGAQGSGILTSMSAADGLLVIAADRPGAAAGERLPVLLLGGTPLGEEPGY